jgi:hypothetical protein
MMITVNRIADSITGSCNMKPFGVKFSQAKYDEMKRLEKEANNAVSMVALVSITEQFEILMKEDYKELIETECPFIFVNEATGKFFLQNNKVISKRPLPQAFVERILTSVEKGIDFLPIVKAWTRFMRNRNYSDEKARRFANYLNKTYMDQEFRDHLMSEEGVSQEVATERATQFQTPITAEGLISTYKVSSELLVKHDPKTGESTPRYDATFDIDSGEAIPAVMPDHVEDRIFYPAVQGLTNGDAFTCETMDGFGKLGHFIKVGHRHFLEEWDQVNCNDNSSCVKGLHAGNLDYIRGYQGQGKITHNVFIDPMNIGAITDDGSGALRVKEYFVHSSFAGVNRNIYHSSKYAALTDAQWADARTEAIANADAKAEADAQVVTELNSL